MSLSVALTGLVGVLTPLATAVVQQPTWTPRLRSIVGVVVSVVLAAATVYGEQAAHLTHATLPTLLGAVTAVIVAAQATYHGLYKPTGLAPALERVTSPQFVMPTNSPPPLDPPAPTVTPPAKK